MTRFTAFLLCSSLAASLAGLAGCGGGTNTAETEAEASQETTSLPTASIGGPRKTAEANAPEPGSPQWNLEEIRKIRKEPLPETDDVNRLASVRKERNEKIMTLATSVIAATHQDPELEDLFVAGVHHLMEARMQLALQGSRDDTDALYADSESLQKKFPKSKAAAEAVFIRVRFAHTNAQRFGAQEPRWLQEFARQARGFAADFPEEETRATMLLNAAGWSCELHGLNEEAIGCYSALEKRFPKHSLASQAAGSTRRLQLKGRPLELAGPTLDGGFTRIDDFPGKVVMVCFWESDSPSFVEVLPRIQAAAEKYRKQGLAVIGVNLDDEEAAVTAFLEQNPLSWPQIFHPDPSLRRWDNPVVKYYGVRDVPMLWLVDRDGIVVDTNVDPTQLDEILPALLALPEK